MPGQFVSTQVGIKPSQVAKMSKGKSKRVASIVEAVNVRGQSLGKALKTPPKRMGGEKSTVVIFETLKKPKAQPQKQQQKQQKQQTKPLTVAQLRKIFSAAA